MIDDYIIEVNQDDVNIEVTILAFVKVVAVTVPHWSYAFEPATEVPTAVRCPDFPDRFRGCRPFASSGLRAAVASTVTADVHAAGG